MWLLQTQEWKEKRKYSGTWIIGTKGKDKRRQGCNDQGRRWLYHGRHGNKKKKDKDSTEWVMTLLQLKQQLKMLLCLQTVSRTNTHTNTHGSDLAYGSCWRHSVPHPELQTPHYANTTHTHTHSRYIEIQTTQAKTWKHPLIRSFVDAYWE